LIDNETTLKREAELSRNHPPPAQVTADEPISVTSPCDTLKIRQGGPHLITLDKKL